jgi:hypothetical protein
LAYVYDKFRRSELTKISFGKLGKQWKEFAIHSGFLPDENGDWSFDTTKTLEDLREEVRSRLLSLDMLLTI